MKKYTEYTEQVEWQVVLPELDNLEKELKSRGIEGDVIEQVFDITPKDEFKELFDPVTLGAGAYALKKGYDKLGGWQGIKNIAQAGAQGLKNTAQGIKTAYQGNRLAADRQAATNAVQRVGGTASLPTMDPGDPNNIQRWASSIDNSLQAMQSNASSMVGTDPEMRRLADTIRQATAAMQRRVGQLQTV